MRARSENGDRISILESDSFIILILPSTSNHITHFMPRLDRQRSKFDQHHKDVNLDEVRCIAAFIDARKWLAWNRLAYELAKRVHTVSRLKFLQIVLGDYGSNVGVRGFKAVTKRSSVLPVSGWPVHDSKPKKIAEDTKAILMG